MQDRGPAAYVAEFIGTFALVFFVTMAVSLFVTAPTPAAPGVPAPEPFIDWSVIGLVHVFVLFMLIQTLALVSGAHFNPVVTLAMTMSGICSLSVGLFYGASLWILGPVVLLAPELPA